MPTQTSENKDRITYATALGYATARVPVVSPSQLAGEVRLALHGQSYEMASHLVVCDRQKFLGIVTIEALLSSAAESAVDTLMDSSIPVIKPGGDQEIATWRAVQNAATALVVVDENDSFMGIIPPHRLVALLLTEHEGEVSLLGGFLKNISAARSHSQESTLRRIYHRLPWLLLGLAGAMFAADLVGWFETQLELKMMLAFFIPGIVYMADAVGTQTETLVVRGLSVGVPLRQMLGRELLSGVVVGVVLASIAAPFVWLHWGDADLALCVSLSLFFACSMSTLIAMSLPWVLDSHGIDPAYGSGPLATVLQDLLSILIYFLVATTVLG